MIMDTPSPSSGFKWNRLFRALGVLCTIVFPSFILVAACFYPSILDLVYNFITTVRDGFVLIGTALVVLLMEVFALFG